MHFLPFDKTSLFSMHKKEKNVVMFVLTKYSRDYLFNCHCVATMNGHLMSG